MAKYVCASVGPSCMGDRREEQPFWLFFLLFDRSIPLVSILDLILQGLKSFINVVKHLV